MMLKKLILLCLFLSFPLKAWVADNHDLNQTPNVWLTVPFEQKDKLLHVQIRENDIQTDLIELGKESIQLSAPVLAKIKPTVSSTLVLGNDLILYEINSDKKIQSLNLRDNFPGLSFSNETLAHWPKKLLALKSVFLKGQWRPILVGLIPSLHPQWFALELNSSLKSSVLLWTYPFKKHSDVIEKNESTYEVKAQVPHIVKLKNGNWVAAFIQTRNHRTEILLHDLSSGFFVNRYVFPSDDSIEHVLFVDSKRAKSADSLYISEIHGKIWKINLDEKNSTEIFYDDALSSYGILTSGYHPHTKDILLYVIKQSPNTRVLKALGKINGQTQVLFESKNDRLTHNRLHQGFLVTHESDQIQLLDAFSGEKQSVHPSSPVLEWSHAVPEFEKYPTLLFEKEALGKKIIALKPSPTGLLLTTITLEKSRLGRHNLSR